MIVLWRGIQPRRGRQFRPYTDKLNTALTLPISPERDAKDGQSS